MTGTAVWVVGLAMVVGAVTHAVASPVLAVVTAGLTLMAFGALMDWNDRGN